MSPDFELIIIENGRTVFEDLYSYSQFNGTPFQNTVSLENFINKYVQKGRLYVGNHITFHRTVSFIIREGKVKWNVPLSECGVLEFVKCFNSSITIEYVYESDISFKNGLYDYISEILLFLGEYTLDNLPVTEIKKFVENFVNDRGECADIDSLFEYIRTKEKWELNELMEAFESDNCVITRAILLLCDYSRADDNDYVYCSDLNGLAQKAFNVWKKSNRYPRKKYKQDDLNSVLSQWINSCECLYRNYETLKRNLSTSSDIVELFKSNLRSNLDETYNIYSLVEKMSEEAIVNSLVEKKSYEIELDNSVPIKIISCEVDEKINPYDYRMVYVLQLTINRNAKIRDLFNYCGLYDQRIYMLDPDTKKFMLLEIPYYDDGTQILWNLDYDNATVDSYCQYHKTDEILIAPYNYQSAGIGSDIGSLFQTVYENINVFLAANPLANTVLSAILGVAFSKIKFKKPVDDLESRGATYSSIMMHLDSRNEWDESELMKKYKIDDKDDLEMIMFGFHYTRSEDGKYTKIT